ncbi:hypothetical protein QZH52_33545, partial [Variovorax ginsengisoli]|nr:hypothetical protein [Variovorax ginsengisoli]MDO1537203.1 hypothetical protein [Variovorax ginsengisoli]
AGISGSTRCQNSSVTTHDSTRFAKISIHRRAQCGSDRQFTYLRISSKKRVKGYKPAWRMASPGVEPTAFESLRALLSGVATNLNPRKTCWRLGGLVLFFDMTVEGLKLKASPPKNVVLCMDLDDLMNADIRSTLPPCGRNPCPSHADDPT